MQIRSNYSQKLPLYLFLINFSLKLLHYRERAFTFTNPKTFSCWERAITAWELCVILLISSFFCSKLTFFLIFTKSSNETFIFHAKFGNQHHSNVLYLDGPFWSKISASLSLGNSEYGRGRVPKIQSIIRAWLFFSFFRYITGFKSVTKLLYLSKINGILRYRSFHWMSTKLNKIKPAV